jgi:hypothetical protein
MTKAMMKKGSNIAEGGHQGETEKGKLTDAIPQVDFVRDWSKVDGKEGSGGDFWISRKAENPGIQGATDVCRIERAGAIETGIKKRESGRWGDCGYY